MKDINILRDAGFNVDRSITVLGGVNMYEEILNDFYKSTLERVKKIIECKKSGDLLNYATYVHAMKSECQYLGITTLADVAFTHQTKAQEKDVAFINSNYDNLMIEINKVLSVIKQFFGY